MSNKNTKEFTDSNFKSQVLEAKGVTLVDFWAPWCGPCRMMTPVIDETANNYQGKATIGKLNTDDNPNIAAQFSIRSIPTIIVFKDGKPVDTITGAVPKDQLASKIDSALA